MGCSIKSEEHRGHLLAYSAGTLSGQAEVALKLHMRDCPECAAFGHSQTNVWNLLDQWQPLPVSPDFNRKLYARIEAEESASWLSRLSRSFQEFLRPIWARPAFPLAAASLVILAGFVLDHPGKVGSRSVQASLHAVSGETGSVELDQVEANLDDMDMLRQFDLKSESKNDDGHKDNSSKSM